MGRPGVISGATSGLAGGFFGMVLGALVYASLRPFGRGTNGLGSMIVSSLAEAFVGIIFSTIPAMICAFCGGLFGSLAGRLDVGTFAGGIVGLLVAYGVSPGWYLIAAATCWGGGAAGGWFAALDRLRGSDGPEPRLNLYGLMVWVAIAAVHLGVYTWLRGQP